MISLRILKEWFLLMGTLCDFEPWSLESANWRRSGLCHLQWCLRFCGRPANGRWGLLRFMPQSQRTLKQGVLILSWQSPLGYGTSRRPREMSITLEAMGESGLPMNFLKSGMYSKLLTIVCQKDRGQNPFRFCLWSFENMLTLEKETWYPGTVREMVQEWPANLESNFWDGLPAFCCVGEGWYRFGSPQRSRLSHHPGETNSEWTKQTVWSLKFIWEPSRPRP